MGHAQVVTISASYGAGGSLIAPRLATALGLTFADRLLTTEVTDDPGDGSTPVGESEREEGVWTRFLDRLAIVTGGMTLAPVTTDDVRRPLRETVEASVGKLACEGAVILGRAACLVLAEQPGVFHVRLDGPRDRRLRRGMAIEQIDKATAERHLEETDRARERYVDRLYGRRTADPSLYHLVLDATALTVDDAVALLQQAAGAFWARELSAGAAAR